jgi:regulator of replication initiation timing
MLHDPLAVNTSDACWVRKAYDREGHGLYALADSVELYPSLWTIRELAERGLRGMVDALPMPVGRELTEVEQLQAQVAALLAERHSTNESLTLAAEALRENRDRLAELTTAAATVRAAALKEAAEELMAACPEHGNADEAWMDCPCEFAEELVRKAALAEAGMR